MLVPLRTAYRCGRRYDEKTSRPGPAISILPKLENADGTSVGSSDATDMIVGEFAGAPVGPAVLPAAAMISRPLANAAVPAAVYAGWTPVGAPSDIEITGQRSAIAQFIPAITLAPTLMPEFAST
jgi:hypothetical protein